ncbi:hypothetical protein [Nocardia concava]|uniref:hypothetical protein n=1 Tax=Nocardia concava TaxID=257281 RepID=UPI000593C52D|nr:hypothetical protein [Nocardia concava]
MLTEPVSTTVDRVAERLGVAGSDLMAAVGEVAQAWGVTGDLGPLELGLVSEAEWAADVAKHLQSRGYPCLDLDHFGERYWFPGRERAEEWIDVLSRWAVDTDVEVVLLTNVASEWEDLMLAMLPESGEIFTEIIVSSRIGASKPNRSAYRAVVERFPDACGFIFVDDSPVNVQAACEMGWEALLFTSAADVAPLVEDAVDRMRTAVRGPAD